MHGVVKAVKRQILVIKLESGLFVEVPKAHDYGIGDVVNLAYDFTKGEVRGLLPPASEEQEDGTSPVKETPETGTIESIEESTTLEPEYGMTETPEEPEYDEIADIDETVSGALSLVCERWLGRL